MAIILFVALYLLFSCFGMVLIKYGSANNSFDIAEKVVNLKLGFYTIVGLVLYLMSFVMWVIVLQKFKLSYISPLVSGISYALIIVLSLLVLHEKISGFQWAGIVIIFIGVILMNIK